MSLPPPPNVPDHLKRAVETFARSVAQVPGNVAFIILVDLPEGLMIAPRASRCTSVGMLEIAKQGIIEHGESRQFSQTPWPGYLGVKMEGDEE